MEISALPDPNWQTTVSTTNKVRFHIPSWSFNWVASDWTCQVSEAWKRKHKTTHARHYSTEDGSDMNIKKIIFPSPPKNNPGNSDQQKPFNIWYNQPDYFWNLEHCWNGSDTINENMSSLDHSNSKQPYTNGIISYCKFKTFYEV
jgi:hypothetical protein